MSEFPRISAVSYIKLRMSGPNGAMGLRCVNKFEKIAEGKFGFDFEMRVSCVQRYHTCLSFDCPMGARQLDHGFCEHEHVSVSSCFINSY